MLVAGRIASRRSVVATVSVVEARVDTAGRRRFTVEEKRQIVAEYRAATDSVERGMVLRRWGTYQQNVSRWGREIEAGTLGTKSKGPDPKDQAKLRLELRRAKERLAKAEAENETLKELVRAQGKALGLHAETTGSPELGQD
jgi:transposase-like protein